VVATTGAVRRANLQSNVTTNKPTPNFLETGLLPNRATVSIVEALERNISRARFYGGYQ